MRRKVALSNPPYQQRAFHTIIAVIAVIISLAFSLFSPLAYAADQDEEVNNLTSEFIGEDSFEQSLTKAEKESSEEVNENSFAYVMMRLISSQYLNNVKKGVAASGLPSASSYKNSNGDEGYLCNKNNSHSGTPLYHNCDIPNFMGAAIQSVYGLFSSQGIRGGEITQNKLWIPSFGLPSTIPNNEVPAIITSSSTYKYTGLEVFGYNLSYTSYPGEWDDIKVMNEARMLSNFSGIDYLKLGWNSLLNGVAASFGAAGRGWSAGWENGGLFGAIGGFYTGFYGGDGAGAVFRTLLDSSDLNVVNTNAWYRNGYGTRSYGIRERTAEEQAELMVKLLNDYLNSSAPVDPGADPNMTALLEGSPGAPIDEEGAPISWSEWYNSSTNSFNKKYVQFFRENSGLPAATSCPAPSDGASASTISTFVSCAPGALATIREEDWNKRHEGSFKEWSGKMATSENFNKWLEENDKANFSAPWNLYVCVNEAGVDETGGDGVLTKEAWDKNGAYQCSSPARVPIQNGLFGNGYQQGQGPQIDTRHIGESSGGAILALIGLDSKFNSVSNFALNITGFFTRISNTVLNLAFSPIFKELGINDIAENLIESFRDGIFAPLLVMAIAFASLYVLWQTGTKRNYSEQFKNLALIVFTAFLGMLLLYNPAKLIQWAEDIPAKVEVAVAGTIFEVGREETSKLCTATGTVVGTTPGEDLEGGALPLDPNASIRTMMCGNWLSFYYSPYVFGQWGTSLESLNAAGTSSDQSMTNTNAALVGDAAVTLGPGSNGVIKNWAVYQTRMMTAGSATTYDGNALVGRTNSNLYKIVDLQAGPNNAAGADTTYFEDWAGRNPMGRLMTSLISIVSSFLGMVVVIAYSIKLLEIKLMTTLMLIIAPFMFLAGVIPGQGRMKLKKYGITLAVLMIQRVLLVALLAVMMRVMLGLTAAATGFVMLFVVSIAVPLVFMSYRKDILGMIEQSAMSMGGGLTPKGREMMSQASAAVPLSLRNKASTTKAAFAGGVTGAMAGAVVGSKIRDNDSGTETFSGGVSGAVEGWKQGYEQHKQVRSNKNRRLGLGSLERQLESANVARDKTTGDFYRDQESTKAVSQVQEVANQKVNEEIAKAAGNSTSGGPSGGNTSVSTIELSYRNDLQKTKALRNASQRMVQTQMEINDLNQQISNMTNNVQDPSLGMLNPPDRVKEVRKLTDQRRRKEELLQEQGKVLAQEVIKENPELLTQSPQETTKPEESTPVDPYQPGGANS